MHLWVCYTALLTPAGVFPILLAWRHCPLRLSVRQRSKAAQAMGRDIVVVECSQVTSISVRKKVSVDPLIGEKQPLFIPTGRGVAA
jgi:hypothetical protein